MSPLFRRKKELAEPDPATEFNVGGPVQEKPGDKDLMAYIDREVRSACVQRGWRHQVRRKWSAREKPVSRSTLEDYEWKLAPDLTGEPENPEDYEGRYYVLWFDRDREAIILQHSTSHCGAGGPHFEVSTYSMIQSTSLYAMEQGWLKDHLLRLVSQFEPNQFSFT